MSRDEAMLKTRMDSVLNKYPELAGIAEVYKSHAMNNCLDMKRNGKKQQR